MTDKSSFFVGGERGIRSCFLLNILNLIFCNVSQKASVTVLKTTHRVVLLTAFESLYYILLIKRKKTPRGCLSFYGGERGIRTLGTVLAFTRFPVVRLRPAQPSLQVDFNIISHLFLKIKCFFQKNQNIYQKYFDLSNYPYFNFNSLLYASIKTITDTVFSTISVIILLIFN